MHKTSEISEWVLPFSLRRHALFATAKIRSDSSGGRRARDSVSPATGARWSAARPPTASAAVSILQQIREGSAEGYFNRRLALLREPALDSAEVNGFTDRAEARVRNTSANSRVMIGSSPTEDLWHTGAGSGLCRLYGCRNGGPCASVVSAQICGNYGDETRTGPASAWSLPIARRVSVVPHRARGAAREAAVFARPARNCGK